MSTIDLGGVIPALITPLDQDGGIDQDGVRRLVEHVIAGGVTALLPLGSTGETALLDERSRRTLLAAVVEAGAGRVPVICGVAQPTLGGAEAEVRAAGAAGAAAVLVAPPFYYPTDQPAVLEFYRRVRSASPVPVLVYNIPQFTKVTIEPPSLSTLAHEGTVAGIKDSSRDFEYFSRVVGRTRDLPGFRVYTGSDTMLLASLAMGGTGTICGGANVAPSWIRRIYDLFQAADLVAARAEQDRLVELIYALRAGVFPTAIKAALEAMGICQAWAAAPVARLEETAAARLRGQLEAAGLLPARVAAS